MTEHTQTNEAHEQHLLLLVESAQRAGLTEGRISRIVDDALRVDAELEQAA